MAIEWVKAGDTSQLYATIPADCPEGKLDVSVGDGRGNSVTLPITVVDMRANIKTLSITSGQTGSSLTLTGTGFGSEPKADSTDGVMIGGKKATPTSWADTKVVVTVPADADDTGVTVIRDGVPSKVKAFSVQGEVTSLEPASAAAGASVTLSGKGFGPTQGKVTFTTTTGSVEAQITSWSEKEIVVTVPDSASTGRVSVARKGSAPASGGAYGFTRSTVRPR